jgi:hypothetical protein
MITSPLQHYYTTAPPHDSMTSMSIITSVLAVNRTSISLANSSHNAHAGKAYSHAACLLLDKIGPAKSSHSCCRQLLRSTDDPQLLLVTELMHPMPDNLI